MTFSVETSSDDTPVDVVNVSSGSSANHCPNSTSLQFSVQSLPPTAAEPNNPLSVSHEAPNNLHTMTPGSIDMSQPPTGPPPPRKTEPILAWYGQSQSMEEFTYCRSPAEFPLDPLKTTIKQEPLSATLGGHETEREKQSGFYFYQIFLCSTALSCIMSCGFLEFGFHFFCFFRIILFLLSNSL